MLYVLIGCDIIFFFFGKGKRIVWDIWSVFFVVIDVLVDLFLVLENIFDDYMLLIERFVVFFYSRISIVLIVNEVRREFFLKKLRVIENISLI